MENAFFRFLILTLTFGWVHGRVVKVPEGPLIRVEGQAVSVRCDVSDYEGPREQDFEWKVARGGRSLQLVSTFDPSYSDPSMQDRVDSGDIAVARLADDTVELRIRSVQAADGGVYSCSTISTDSVISGNYEADVELKVIKDSVKVSPTTPPAVIPEGGSLELRCSVSRDITQHTYLSVIWSVRKGATSEDILTFDPERGVTTGSSFRQRYADGCLRLDLQGRGAYGLIMNGALPGDQGVYVCTAREWALEKGGTWQKILERSADMGEVRVTPTAQSLKVTLEKNSTLSVDDTLNLTCSVAADGLAALSLEVEWLVSPASGGGAAGPRVLVRVGQDGVVMNTSPLVGVSRLGVGVFGLVLHGVDQSASGLHSCRVRAWVRQSSGDWHQAAEKTSNLVQVQVILIEPEFNVALHDISNPQFSGDLAELECQVTEVSRLQGGQLGVSWHYTEVMPADLPTSTHYIAALDKQGNLKAEDRYRERVEKGLLILSRVEPNTFKLNLLQAWDSDMGAYFCTVSAWTHTRGGGWAKAKEVVSNPLTIHWTPKKPKLSVTAESPKLASSAGSTFEMRCQVTGENLQNPEYSVLIQVEETGGKTREILSLSPDSVLQLEEWNDQGREDSVVLEKTGPVQFRFRLYGVQVSDRGSYSCSVTAHTRGPGNAWTPAISAESNKVLISFTDTGPAFNVSIHSEKSSIFPGETAKIECTMTVQGASLDTADMSYEVRWYKSNVPSMGSAALLGSMDRWGVVRKSPGNGSSDCSLERMDAWRFRLSIHSAQDIDSGEYHCSGTPWIRSPAGTWTRGQDLTSSSVFLSVNLALWDSLKLPLLYGVAASLGAGLLSLLLGWVCARCCCQNATHSPRSHNGLMDLEMD
ncbi:hypothetical protein MATL_G00154970 [Megalops atlanticus]|uniref:Ig-like domain-containing protein n=1 Tax=Megalops atlanticus TaxID=7932 RepID=A0A9D3PSU5_MEGAT|nr:hypothetical protein MATL_G00154970 [Megalops atlanticus]